VIPSVAASERGPAQTKSTSVLSGLWDLNMGLMMGSRTVWKVRPKWVIAP
jgi:hypothetical protein